MSLDKQLTMQNPVLVKGEIYNNIRYTFLVGIYKAYNLLDEEFEKLLIFSISFTKILIPCSKDFILGAYFEVIV